MDDHHALLKAAKERDAQGGAAVGLACSVTGNAP